MISSATALWAILQMMKYRNMILINLFSFSLFFSLYRYIYRVFPVLIIPYICTIFSSDFTVSWFVSKFVEDARNGSFKFTKDIEVTLQSHGTATMFSEKSKFERSLDCNGKSAESKWNKECLRAKGKETGNKLGAGGGPGWKKEEKEELRSARRQFGSPCSRLAATKWFTKQ